MQSKHLNQHLYQSTRKIKFSSSQIRHTRELKVSPCPSPSPLPLQLPLPLGGAGAGIKFELGIQKLLSGATLATVDLRGWGMGLGCPGILSCV